VVVAGMDKDLDPQTITAATRQYVRAIALRIVKDPADAEDVAQDALILAFRYRDSFRGDCRYCTWLHRVTQTAALMFLRKRRRYRRELGEAAQDGQDGGAEPARDDGASLLARASTPATADKVLACREELARTRQVVARLGRRYPEVFWMRYGEGYTETEIARALGLSLATVKTRAHRAKLAAQAACPERAAA
jgi:RNA polymerase sigma-70 factor (ECF subfamily)